MNLVVFKLHNPQTLEFIITRPKIVSFEEILQGYQQYMVFIQRAAALGQKMHVILNLRAVTSLDSNMWTYVTKMREILKNTPDIPPTVIKLTVQLASGGLRTVVKQILSFCVGKHVAVDITA